MTKWELIEYCLTFADAYEDYPFDEEWAAMRHVSNQKNFAFIYERGGKLCVNLKCEPMQADFWRRVYSAVTPAYHMNKQHWNTVVVDMSLSDEEIYEMINHSYCLTAPKAKKARYKIRHFLRLKI